MEKKVKITRNIVKCIEEFQNGIISFSSLVDILEDCKRRLFEIAEDLIDNSKKESFEISKKEEELVYPFESEWIKLEVIKATLLSGDSKKTLIGHHKALEDSFNKILEFVKEYK